MMMENEDYKKFINSDISFLTDYEKASYFILSWQDMNKK